MSDDVRATLTKGAGSRPSMPDGQQLWETARRRHTRRRTLVAAGSMVAVAAVALAVPSLWSRSSPPGVEVVGPPAATESDIPDEQRRTQSPAPMPTASGTMRAEPTQARAGQALQLHFEGGDGRGIVFALLPAGGQTPDDVIAWMYSDGNAGKPSTVLAADAPEDLSAPAVRVSDAGPDQVVLPDSIAAGEYQVCAAGPHDQRCAPVTVE